MLGGGSNLVVADDGLRRARSSGSRLRRRGRRRRLRRRRGRPSRLARTGTTFVARAVEAEWIGVEALSGIPGTVGATPIQNVGAYGQEVAETIAPVHVYDRLERRRRTLSPPTAASATAPASSSRPGRYVVGAVTFQFRLGSLGAPVRYAELARALGVEVGGAGRRRRECARRCSRLRRRKGMVLDPTDHDTWSAGSFFTNPFVEPSDGCPTARPAFPQPDGTVKTSAAWLIEQAGFGKGYGNGRVGLSTKHTLALTNRGGATTADLLALAREIRDGVRAKFGIALHPEPTLLGCDF